MIILIMTIPIIFLLQGTDITAKLKKVSDDDTLVVAQMCDVRSFVVGS